MRTRILRWLLTVLTLAGIGVLQAGHCPTGTAPAAVSTIGAVAVPTAAAEARPGSHHQSLDSGRPQDSDTAADNCHLEPAPATAATVTGAAVHPPARIGTVPVGVPAAAGKPRLPTAATLTEIGVSRK
ncbi:hypothetical protein [Actinoplanes campanulatus]|nr:hypothetical protein [Actinoplanes capillaceus]